MPNVVTDRLDGSGRASARWWPLHWTSPLVGEQPRPISLFDLIELRGTVDTHRVAGGLDPIRWIGRTDDDPTFVAGLTPIRAVHFSQLRAALVALWQLAELGPLPEFRAGPILPGTRVISIRDPIDLRSWIEQYETARPDLAARVAWRYPEQSWIWPMTDQMIPSEPPVEVWDVTGHALFWKDPTAQQWTELRRIDTHWHRIDAYSDAGASAVITTDPRVSMDSLPSISMAIDSTTVCPEGDLRYVTWESPMPRPEDTWTLERDWLGRVVRVLDGDTVLRRIAYDGFGRARKLVDTVTWHVVGPGLVLSISPRQPDGVMDGATIPDPAAAVEGGTGDASTVATLLDSGATDSAASAG